MSENDSPNENGAQNGNDGRSNHGGQSRQNRQSGQNEQSRDTGPAEKAMMALSVAITVLLFAYAAWHTVGGPVTAPPKATVVGTDRLPNGDVAVTFKIHNPRDVGLVTATVESDCTSPPTEVQFSYLPADSTETGTLVCPSNTTSPTVSVSNWVEA